MSFREIFLEFFVEMVDCYIENGIFRKKMRFFGKNVKTTDPIFADEIFFANRGVKKKSNFRIKLI